MPQDQEELNLQSPESMVGRAKFEINESKAWQFGSLLFRLTRGLQEWRLEYYRPRVQYDYEQQWHQISDPLFAFPTPVKLNAICSNLPKANYSLCLGWQIALW